MFTGIIQAVGSIASMQDVGGDKRVRLNTNDLPLADVELGDSIAVSGVCLTVIEKHSDGFSADVSGETLSRTGLGNLKKSSAVNLEKAVTPTTALGGHLVSGHVDGIGEIIKRQADARSVQFSVRAPAELARYIAEKGSICIDGISLTVNAVNGDVFELNIVPHTLTQTTMDGFDVGTKINLEVDIIARYLERLLLGDRAAEKNISGAGLTQQFLAENGFAAES
ncbi:MAG: riboflavin synthase [Sulfuriflexus sp.]|nr:riboflavin synthase [Sulfuriflexus sp.]